MKPSDAQIIADIRNGNREAYRILVERYQDRLFGVLLRLAGDRDLAEEAAQDAFVRAYQALPRFRGESAFGTWLVQIGIHAVRDRARSQERRRRFEVAEAAGVPAPEPAIGGPGDDALARLVANEQRDQLLQALQRLPADYREVLVLKHLEEWSFEEIAEHAETSVGALKVRAHRARRMLRDAITELKTTRPPAAPAGGSAQE